MIAVVASLNVLGCGWLIWWTARSRPNEVAKGEVTDHVWDGDLQERNNPMPRWWLILFFLSIVFCLLYFLLYPGARQLRRCAGLEQGVAVRAGNGRGQEAVRAICTRHFAGRAIEDLAKDPKALALGRSLFANNCTACHGSDARGAPGFPICTDNDWLHGGERRSTSSRPSPTAAKASCRRSAPAWAIRASMRWPPMCSA